MKPHEIVTQQGLGWDGAVMMRRARSDEWVHQTRELSIQSPALDAGERLTGAHYGFGRASEGTDVPMVRSFRGSPVGLGKGER